MKISQISEYVLGCCEVSVKGWYGEELLNIATAEGIELWSIRRKRGDELTARVFIYDVNALLSLPQEHPEKLSGVEVSELRRWGLPTLLYRLRRRGGLLAGAAILALTVLVMSSFVWQIRVSGNNAVNETELLQALENCGIYIGSFTSGHDIRRIKLELMQKFENIAFVGINIHGSTVDVDVTERRMPPDVVSDDSPCNVVASRDGFILSADTYVGVPYVREHQSVSKGQLLVGGVIDSRIVGYRLVPASAKIMALTRHTFSAYCPVQDTELRETGRQTVRYSVRIFGMEIKIPFIGNNDFDFAETVSQTVPLKVGDAVFPLSLTRYELTELEQVTVEHDEESAREKLRCELDEAQRVGLAGLEIIEKNEHFSFDGNGYRGEYVYTVRENIARTHIIENEVKK